MRLEALEDRRLLAVFTVDTFDDNNDGNTSADNFSLREAVLAANSAPGPDTIRLPDGFYQLTLTGSNDDLGLTGDLDITDDVTIIAINGDPANVLIDGNGADRIFDILSGGGLERTVELNAISIQNGSALDGGGIRSSIASLSLIDCVVDGNTTSGNGGGILYTGSDTTELTLTRTSVKNNRAQSPASVGGGIAVFPSLSPASVRLTEATIADNTSVDSGAGLYGLDAGFTAVDTVFSGNISQDEGGGVLVESFNHTVNASVTRGGFVGNSSALGGGALLIVEMSATIDSTTFEGNEVTGANSDFADGGGGLTITSASNDKTLTITGALFQSNTAPSGGAFAAVNVLVDITDSSILNNQAVFDGAGGGGGIGVVGTPSALRPTLIMTDVIVTNNSTAGVGGGGVGLLGATARIIRSTISQNQAINPLGNAPDTGLGGGIGSAGNGTIPLIELRQSVVDNNTAVAGGGITIIDGQLRMENTTISNNNAVNGAAMAFRGNVSGIADFSTIAFNSTGANIGSAIASQALGAFQFSNTIIENAFGSTSNAVAVGPDSYQSLGFNLISDSTISNVQPSDLINATANLQPLADNGGTTRTHALGVGSLALDGADPNAVISADQRDTLRPIDGNSDSNAVADIGAFEAPAQIVSASSDLAILLTDGPDPVIAGASMTLIGTLRNLGPDTANNTSAVVTLPAGFTFVSGSGPGFTFNPTSPSTIFVNAGSVTSGQVRSFNIVTTAPSGASAPGTYTSSVAVSSASTDPVPGNNIASTTTTVSAASTSTDVQVTQSANLAAVSPGDNLTFTITVLNNGPLGATGVETDLLVDNANFVSGTVSNGGTLSSGAGGSIIANIGNVASGGSVTVTIVTNVPVGAIGTVTSSVGVTANESDTNPANNSDSGSVPIIVATPELTIGLATRGVEAIDWNSDGFQDLVFINELGNDVVFAINNGQGLFTLAERQTLGSRPRSLAVARDAQGQPVVAIADAGTPSTAGQLFIVRPGGSITSHSTGNGPIDVAIADFNGDRELDFATVAFRTGTVHVLLSGNDTATLIGTIDQPVALDAGDMDGDGKIDLVVAGTGYSGIAEPSLMLLSGDGKGGFTESVRTPISTNISELEFIDLDKTVPGEIATISDGSVVTIWSLAQGSTTEFTTRQAFGTSSNSAFSGMAVGDINSDGFEDLAISDLRQGTVRVYTNLGNGSLGAPSIISGLSTPSDVVIAALDGQNRPNLATSNYFRTTGTPSAPSFSYFSNAAMVAVNFVSPTPTVTGRLLSTPQVDVVSLPLELQANNFPTPVQTAASALDVNDDRRLTPLDALLVIDAVQRQLFAGSGEASNSSGSLRSQSSYDVNGDGKVSPLDALLIINRLNAIAASGEPSGAIGQFQRDLEREEQVDAFFDGFDSGLD